MKYLLRIMKIEELEETITLVEKVFNEFEAPYYTKEGVESFYKFANYDNLKSQLEKNMKMLVVKDNNKIIGVIGFKEYSHISLLFVDKEYHKQGIAKELVRVAKSYCRKNNQNLSSITVNSSPYAIEFYHRLGFIDTNVEQTIDGIRFTPMKIDIYNFKRFEEKEFEYLYQIKKECFKWYVEKVYGEWNEDIQIKFFRDEMTRRPDAVKVITYKGNSIGLFTNYVNDENNSFIELFYIDKKYRGRGIGTEILKEQLEEDRMNLRDTMLRVFKDNPARFLYQKVGFEICEEKATHYEMMRKIKKEGMDNG